MVVVRALKIKPLTRYRCGIGKPRNSGGNHRMIPQILSCDLVTPRSFGLAQNLWAPEERGSAQKDAKITMIQVDKQPTELAKVVRPSSRRGPRPSFAVAGLNFWKRLPTAKTNGPGRPCHIVARTYSSAISLSLKAFHSRTVETHYPSFGPETIRGAASLHLHWDPRRNHFSFLVYASTPLRTKKLFQ